MTKTNACAACMNPFHDVNELGVKVAGAFNDIKQSICYIQQIWINVHFW